MTVPATSTSAPTTLPVWDRARVEARLIDAFRVMPSQPIYGAGDRLLTMAGRENALTSVLEWARFLDRDRDGQRALWTWARCQAAEASFAAHCEAAGWNRSTAERHRRRAADAIAAALVQRQNAQASVPPAQVEPQVETFA